LSHQNDTLKIPGLLVGEITLVIAGVGFYVWSVDNQLTFSIGQTICNSVIGETGQALIADADEMCTNVNNAAQAAAYGIYLGPTLGIVGFIIAVRSIINFLFTLPNL
jgi:hypothetical protein